MVFKKKISYTILMTLSGLLMVNFVFAGFELAEKAFQNRVFNFAIINYEKALTEESDPLKREMARYRLTESYYQTSQWDKVLNSVQEYIKTYSKGKWLFNVRYLQALAFFKNKNYVSAQTIIKSLIKNYPQHAELHKLIFTLAQIYQDLGRYQEAIETLQVPMNKFDNDRNYLKSRIHYQNQNYQIALGEIQKVDIGKLQVFSLDESVDLQVEILLKIQSYDQTLKVIEKYYYRLKNPDYKNKFLFYQSHIYFLQGNYTKAIVQYKNYLQKVKESPYRNDVTFFLALTYFRIEQPIIALEYIAQLEDSKTKAILSTEDEARKDKLGYLIYKDLDRQEKQAEYLNRLLFPGSPEELFAIKEKTKWLSIKNNKSKANGGKISKEMENYLSRYEKLETDSQKRAVFYNQLAEIYFKNNNSEMNVFFSRRAYDNFPNKKYLLGMGDRLSAAESYRQAVEIYESLLPQSQGYEKHYIQDALGYSLFQNGEYQRSIKYYKKNTKVQEDRFRSSALFYLGENYRLLKNYSKAKNYFAQFLDKYIDDNRVPVAYLNLGFVYYYGEKNYSKALKNLDQAYKFLDSKNEGVIDLVKDRTFRNNIFQLRFRCYLDLKDEKKAIEQIGLISKKDNPDLYYDNLLLLAKFYFNKQDYTRSLNQYYEIINSENTETHPSDETLEKAYFERIFIKLKEDSGREAYFYLLKLKERFPDSDFIKEGFLSVGDYYYSLKRWVSTETVYKEFEKYAKTPEDSIYALYYLGFTRQQMGKNQEAILQFQTIKKIGKLKNIKNNFYYDSLFELGIYEFEGKRLFEAKKNFQEIVNDSPNKYLRKKAKKNLDIIESINDPNPYAGLKTIEEIFKKIDKVSARSLKEQGYYLVALKYFKAQNYQKVYDTLKDIAPLSRYYEDSVVLVLRSLLSLNNFSGAYSYGMKNYFMKNFELSGDKKEFFYYALAFSSKKLDLRSDYNNFLKLLTDEFPNTEYLKTKK